MVLGDFNIHVNDIDDQGPGPTHKSGNCLDLVFTEEMSKTKAIRCHQSMFMSDHNSIQCILNIPKENCARKEITYRKLKDVDLPQLVKDVIRSDPDRKPR